MTTSYSITIGSDRLPIVIRRHKASRRIVIRYQPLQHVLTVTLPRYAGVRQGLNFIEEKRHWIERQVRETARHIPLADGQAIPVLGREYTLRHAGGRGVVRVEGDAILVPGETEFMARRVSVWLKALAREEITLLACDKAQRVGRKIKKISLRDTSSRWGSCSHEGNLSFSWRLVFAPREVLDYLVSHEVAHLAQHNHSPAFWAVVAKLCPDYDKPQQWLKKHGPTLYAYG